MRKFVFVLATAGAALVMLISLASAQTSRGMQGINTATQNFAPVQQAARQGRGPYCRPGYSLRAAVGDVGAAPATDSSIRGRSR
jgi:hypothetical protein